MSEFDDLMSAKGNGSPIDQLTTGPVIGIDEYKPGKEIIPQSYVDFITNIGHGTIGDDALKLYDGLVDPREIFDFEPEWSNHVALFGDNMSGVLFGFDTRTGSVVEIDAYGALKAARPSNFPDFIRTALSQLSPL
ncbi:hypothetical protein V7S57_21420 [Caulobacter sp. CCNWLY153]|uniref:hypothetical protein n=1 Tax=unclassified Caulobacter TaxID=2648921 RepID=UPI002FF1B3C0